MKDIRILILFLLIILISTAIGSRLFYIQVLNGGYYSALALGQQFVFEEELAQRGDIFLKNRFAEEEGRSTLAATNKEWSLLYAVPKEIEDPEFIATKVSPFIYEKRVRELEALQKNKEDRASNDEDMLKEESVNLDSIKRSIYERIKDKDDPYEPLEGKLEKWEVEEESSRS